LSKLNIKHVVCGNNFTAMQLISLNQRINPKQNYLQSVLMTRIMLIIL